jgi:hypothetical protein
MSPSETGRVKLKRFLQRPLASAFAREGALYAARIVDRLRLHQRLLDRDGIRDPDVFSLLGLELNDRHDGKVPVGDVRDEVSKQLRRLERSVNLRPDALTTNIDKIGDVLRLDSTERAVFKRCPKMKRCGGLVFLKAMTCASLAQIRLKWILLSQMHSSLDSSMKRAFYVGSSEKGRRRSSHWMTSPILPIWTS